MDYLSCDWALNNNLFVFALSTSRFLLNPGALSDDHMIQFRFLGILMAVAIRTKKPLDLHLAPWVWKQLCSMPLTDPDLEEVDVLTYRSLQGILHLENSGITEDNFHVVSYWNRLTAESIHVILFGIFTHVSILFYVLFYSSQLCPWRWSRWTRLRLTVQTEDLYLWFLEVKTFLWPLLIGLNMWRESCTTDCMKWTHR